MARNKNHHSVFLVRTPLQFIIAREAQEHFKIKPSESIILFFTDFAPSQEQIANYYTDTNWAKRISVFNYRNRFISESNLKNIFNYFTRKIKGLFTIYSILLSHRSIEYLFIGHIEDTWMRLFSKNSKAKYTIFLEDGVSTLKIAEKRFNSDHTRPIPINTNKFKSALFNQNFFEKVFLGNQDLVINQICFFTVYNRIPVIQSDYIIENRFKILCHEKKNYVQKKNNEVWLIGQPLVERGIISKYDFIKMLQSIKARFGSDNEYFFIPHRSGTSPNYIEEEGFIIKQLSQPVEIELIKSNFVPEAIGTISSAALINIQKIYEENLNLFYIELGSAFYKKNPDHERIRNYFSGENNLISLTY